VDNEFTLKRLDRERGRVVLRPENNTCPVSRLSSVCLLHIGQPLRRVVLTAFCSSASELGETVSEGIGDVRKSMVLIR